MHDSTLFYSLKDPRIYTRILDYLLDVNFKYFNAVSSAITAQLFYYINLNANTVI